LIEKTVSNCLRIPYIDAVFSEARYIHLIRHGEDVVESVYRQWNAPPDWRYIFKKARTYPLLETPGYALKYIRKAILRNPKKDQNNSAVWGPAYQGIKGDLQTSGMWQVCAIQWAKSIEKAFQGLEAIHAEKVFLIRYEDFVQEPKNWLEKIGGFLSIDANQYNDPENLNLITTGNIGKAKGTLSVEQKVAIKPHMKPAMELCGYSFYP
jgi:hypothetical protein